LTVLCGKEEDYLGSLDPVCSAGNVPGSQIHLEPLNEAYEGMFDILNSGILRFVIINYRGYNPSLIAKFH
jgi:hypothetical protein